MKLGYIILYVPSVADAALFYESAFGMECGFKHEGGDYAEMVTGETKLAFASETLADSHGFAYRKTKSSEDAPSVELALVTTDVQAAFEKAIAAGATPAKHPTGRLIADSGRFQPDDSGDRHRCRHDQNRNVGLKTATLGSKPQRSLNLRNVYRTLIESIRMVNGPGFLSPNKMPTECTWFGLNFMPGILRPNECATNWSIGKRTSTHESALVSKSI